MEWSEKGGLFVAEKTGHVLAHYRLHVVPQEPLALPAFNKGNTIRGGFGTLFRRLVCVDHRLECVACELRYQCAYTQVFNPFVPPGAERLSKNQNIPRPFVVKPPLETQQRYLPGESLVFDFVVVGEAIAYLAYFIVAFRELCQGGFGLNRARCHLALIEAISPNGETCVVYDGRDSLVHPPQQNVSWQHLMDRAQAWPEGHEVRLRFLTPTTLKAEGKIVTVPQFHQLLKRLRDRLNALAYFYCGQPLDLDFKALGERAEQIQTVATHSRWLERSRHTRRGFTQNLSGFVGEVTYRGELRPFLPLLLLGEYMHVGKNAAFGNGWYRLERPGHS